MRGKFSIILIFIGISFCAAQNGVIKGKLIAEIPEEAELISKKTKVILEINGTKKYATLDENLNFSFNNVASDTILIRTEPKSITRNRIITGFLKPNETVEIEIPYSLSCKYDKSKKNKLCPVCERKDEVIPIRYGLIVNNSKKDKGENTKEYKEGGCVITGCDPNWYCKRDEIEF